MVEKISERTPLAQVEKLCLTFEMTLEGRQDSKDLDRGRNFQEKGTVPIKVQSK